MEIKDLKVSQLARAVETITGRPTTAKSFSYKSRAINRVTALMTEHNLSPPEVLQAAGLTMIEIPKPTIPKNVEAVRPRRVCAHYFVGGWYRHNPPDKVGRWRTGSHAHRSSDV